MKKTLIASAVAAATFSGAALAQESNLPTVYGNIQLNTVYTDLDGAGSSFSGLQDNGTTLGVKHSHEIAPGVEGFFKMELEGIAADDKAHSGGGSGADHNGITKLDEAYIGVKGDSFGQIWVGSDDSTFESAIDEIANYYEYGGQNLGGGYDTGEGNLIQYKTPSFSGLTLGGAVQVNGDSDTGGKSYPYQLAATYEMSGLELAVAMDSNDGGRAYSSNSASFNNENTYGARASYSMDNLRVTGLVKTRKDVADVYGLLGSYSMGANTFAASWEHLSPDSDVDDSDVFSVQALHNLSDHMYVYVEGYLGQYPDNTFGPDASDQTDLAIGGTYYF
ncbi:porin [Marinobacter halodurans]|uniref:Porin n=1 Tax=Marinobacter halodurans TaxID=2528979 RepID=A0ABY1ZKH6_9GAMM|nr:porin [Marinobacter halodurans]TBW55906.1 porin [Marinobacter halodurans]